MPINTRAPTLGDLLKHEEKLAYCRESVTLLAGTNYPMGAVLGRNSTSGKYSLSPDTGADGTQTAVAVLLEAVDATGGDKTGLVIVRGSAIVADAALVYHSTVNDATKRGTKQTQLAAVGIVTRKAA